MQNPKLHKPTINHHTKTETRSLYYTTPAESLETTENQQNTKPKQNQKPHKSTKIPNFYRKTIYIHHPQNKSTTHTYHPNTPKRKTPKSRKHTKYPKTTNMQTTKGITNLLQTHPHPSNKIPRRIKPKHHKTPKPPKYPKHRKPKVSQLRKTPTKTQTHKPEKPTTHLL